MRIEKTRPPLERAAKPVVPQTKTGPSEGRKCSELPRVREMTQRSTDKTPVPSPTGRRESEKAGKEALRCSREAKSIAEMTALGRTEGSGVRVCQRRQT